MGKDIDVHVCEVGMRDGLQSIKGFYPTEGKIAWLTAEAAAGVPEIEVCSFVPPKLIPQFQDAAAVCAAALDLAGPDRSYTVSALIPNLIGQGIVLVIVGAPLILAVLAGMRLPAGKGRIAQTLLALAVVLICPCGTLFAAYSLWVCWMNEESSKHLSGTSDVSD